MIALGQPCVWKAVLLGMVTEVWSLGSDKHIGFGSSQCNDRIDLKPIETQKPK